MMLDPTKLTLPERIFRLMCMSDEAAANDPDVEAYQLLDALARPRHDLMSVPFAREIADWHDDGRRNMADREQDIRLRTLREYQEREAETGIPTTLEDITEDVADRLEDLENEGDDDP